MMEKFFLIICYNSRKIVAWLMGFYFLAKIIYRNNFSDIFEKINLPILFFLIGLYLGMSLMAWIIKYLNKPSTREHISYKKSTK